VFGGRYGPESLEARSRKREPALTKSIGEEGTARVEMNELW